MAEMTLNQAYNNGRIEGIIIGIFAMICIIVVIWTIGG